VDFKNTVLILTSNMGAAQLEAVYERGGLDAADRKALVERAVMEEVKKHFRPEFINRLDEVVVFERLEREHIRAIVDLQLARFAERLARRELTLKLTDRAKDLLCDVGWDPHYGARPLKRALRKHLEDPFAKAVLSGRFAPKSLITCDVGSDGQFEFRESMSN
jgi:ATP-dependent Clp protease ATP-binding subunit ClpB